MVERGIDRKLVDPPEISMRMACEEEEFTKEEIYNRSLPELPELCKAQESIHKDDIQLETPKVNTTEISKLPRKIKLEICIEQSKSKLHTKQKKVLGSKVIRRANATKLTKRKLPSICRPPSKPPDRQNSLNYKHETKKGGVQPYKNKKGKTRNPKCRGRRDRCPKEQVLDRQGTKLQAPSKATLYN